MDLLTLKVERQTEFILHVLIRHAVVANERIGEDEDLAAVGGVSECFGVADHSGVEDDFARGGRFGSEGVAFEGGCSIGEVECCFVALVMMMGGHGCMACMGYVMCGRKTSLVHRKGCDVQNVHAVEEVVLVRP